MLEEHLAKYIRAIPYGDRKKIIDAARGKSDLADLASGNPDIQMPECIKGRLMESIRRGYARYTEYHGRSDLREKIAEYLKNRSGIKADPHKEIIVTSGIQEGLYVVMRSILEPGDEIIVPSPHYGNYHFDPIACGAKPVFVQLREDDGYEPDIELLERHINRRTKAIAITQPSNPLGIVWKRETLERLSELAIKHDLLVISDEAYAEHIYEGPIPGSISSLPGMKERTFVLGGFSKSHFIMGLRIGWIVGPDEAIKVMRNLHYVITLCPSSLSQEAALAALDCPAEELKPALNTYRDMLYYLYDRVTSIPGVRCVRPHGTFYMFPNMRTFGMKSLELAIRLVEEAGVITIPGTEFGPYGEGYLRLSVCARPEEVVKGAQRLEEWAAGRNKPSASAGPG